MNKLLILLAIISLPFYGCKKRYADDDWPHTKSPLQRIYGSWEFKKSTAISPYYFSFQGFNDLFIHFDGSGVCDGGRNPVFYIDGFGNQILDPYLINFNGSWELSDDNSKLLIHHDGSHISAWVITQLDRHTMKISNDSILYEFNK
ncbi:MAG: hypothetical protein M3R27_08865 [Bacteroidota bacterium]|nr:hypothetical protein [Bacteroidota bacterium]